MSRSARMWLAALPLSAAALLAGCSGDAAVTTPSIAEAVEVIESGDFTIIDVRTPAEYGDNHVAGADNVDVTAATFEQEIKKYDASGRYVVYCQSGNRSADAANKMADLGFEEVVDAGGISDLASAGVVLEPGQ